MPGYKRKRTVRRRRPLRRRVRKARKASVPRIMRPKVMRFKRDIEETLILSNTVAPEGWTLDGNFRVYKNLAWALASVGDSTDFQNLFRQYRIKGARMRFFFSNTVSGQTGATDRNANSQLMVRMAPNQRGDGEVLDQAYWQSIQAKKYKLGINGGRPIDIYMPLKQKNEIFGSASVTTQYSMVRPKFVSTVASNVSHYGLNIAIDRVDGQGFTTGADNSQSVKIITTLYFEMRGVE